MKTKGDNFEIKTYIIFLKIPINLITIIFCTAKSLLNRQIYNQTLLLHQPIIYEILCKYVCMINVIKARLSCTENTHI